MNEELRTIRLYGKLGTKFGRVHRLAVDSAGEACRALSVLLPGFENELMTSRDRGISYAVFIGKNNISKDEIHMTSGLSDIRIAPILQGRKKAGTLQLIIGIALIIVAPWMPAGYAITGGMMASMGMAMALGGAMQLLSPQQLGLATKDRPDNGASYNFNGPINTVAQGNCVPLLYGEMLIGSATISAGIYAEDQV